MDIIEGKVIRIIDGDTFEIKVSKQYKDNEYEYNPVERIRIRGKDAPELTTPAGNKSKEQLKRKLLHKKVRCYIHSRDKFGRLISDVKILK